MNPDFQSTTNYNTFPYNSHEWDERRPRKGSVSLLGIVVFISIVVLSLCWLYYITHIGPNDPNHWLTANETLA